MKLDYISCMEFKFLNAVLPEYNNIEELRKAIEESKVIKVISGEDKLIDYVNSDYIMYFGSYEEE